MTRALVRAQKSARGPRRCGLSCGLLVGLLGGLLAGLSGCEAGTLVPPRGIDIDATADDAQTPTIDAWMPGDGGASALPDAWTPPIDAWMPPPDSGIRVDADFCETGGMVVMEAEHWRTQTGYSEVPRDDASGGIAMQVGDSGSLDFRIYLATGGTYYFWIRTLAPDSESNGIHVALDGERIRAPDDNPYAGSNNIYLQKSSTRWFWEPMWQGPGSGQVQGPVTFTASAGVHTLSIQKRIIERPLLDRIVLTLAPASPSEMGPPETPCPTFE